MLVEREVQPQGAAAPVAVSKPFAKIASVTTVNVDELTPVLQLPATSRPRMERDLLDRAVVVAPVAARPHVPCRNRRPCRNR